jgi:hypothetical protein
VATSIDIDDDILGLLKAEAEPFEDTPNSALRRLLGLEPGAKPAGTATTGKSARAPLGSLLPESKYELPILQELVDRGGSAPAREVVQAVGERLKDQLTDLDKERLQTGDVRWENRVAFTRLTLKKRGLLKSNSPRGIWEISDEGREAAKAG